MSTRGLMLAFAVGPCAALSAQQYTETFNQLTNLAGWTFGAPVQVLEPTGGCPSGGYLHGSSIDTTIPFLRTGVASPFTGNYRTRRITKVGVCIVVHGTDFPVTGLNPAVILVSVNGTPGDPSDDWGAFRLAPLGLPPNNTWLPLLFVVDAQSNTLPPGWQYIEFGPNVPPGRNWGQLVQSVDRLEFSFGDPSLFYIFQMWNVGADSIWVTSTPTCYGNCDGSTVVPFLNVNDFVCFLNAFSAGDSRANCDYSTMAPVLNVNDFVCFQSYFASGCPAP